MGKGEEVKKPTTPSGKSVEDLRWALEHMLNDLNKYEPVDYK